ncbi:hypothetical protein GCM10010145_62280 [Streptomyces ruber]|uniref:Uncharacterized protein n=2 Tax=Streptomyces TaxID=1883 RepID=A0A918BPH9_9ACTN|nr:hypothetical protein GCM10010145_62280 [Streptomyces ruber]
MRPDRGLLHRPVPGVDGMPAVVLVPSPGAVIAQAAGVVGGAGAGGDLAGEVVGAELGAVPQPGFLGAPDGVVFPGVVVRGAHAPALAGADALHAVAGGGAPDGDMAGKAAPAGRAVGQGEIVRILA